jgi:AhpD family alkylhydroperoxidase
MSQEPRLNYHAAAPKSAQALTALSTTCAPSLEPRLRGLIDLRLSQINGCAFCLDMHSAELLQHGVDQRHLNTLAGWREAHRFFTPRERAALAWAEAVNAVPHRTPSDAEFNEVREHFKDSEIAELSFAVCAIRAWNMLNASFHMPVPDKPYGVKAS